MPNRFPKSEMGVNLATLHSLPELPALPVVQDVLLDLLGVGEVLLSPLGIWGIDQFLLIGCLIGITHKDMGQSAKMHKTAQIRSNSKHNLL